MKENSEIIRKKTMSQGPIKQTQGVKCVKISNITCFVQFKIDAKQKTCHLKIFNRIRPGSLEMTLKDIDLDTLKIDDQLAMLKLSVHAPWDGSWREEDSKSYAANTQNTRGSQRRRGSNDS